MTIFLTLGSLLALFYLIGKSADLVINNVRLLGLHLGIRHFWLGLMLGFFTSMPELIVGVQASFQDVAQLSFGNLMGGVIVLLGLIAGLSVIANNGIDIAKSFRHRELILMVVYISLPLWLMLDGQITVFDGLFLVVAYILCVLYFIHFNYRPQWSLRITDDSSNFRALAMAVLGLLTIVVLAKFMLDLSLPLLDKMNISPFWAGLIFFSLGTNLPELTLAFRSWKSGLRHISLGNLVGAAFAHPLIIGLLAFVKPISLTLNNSYYFFIVFMVFLLVSFVIMSYKDRHLSRGEGWVLVGIYVLFLLTQVGVESF